MRLVRLELLDGTDQLINYTTIDLHSDLQQITFKISKDYKGPIAYQLRFETLSPTGRMGEMGVDLRPGDKVTIEI